MEKNLVTEAERFLHDRHKDKRRTQALRIVAVAVVFVTIYALILPAVTMSNEVECGLAEHIHTDSCWQEQLTPPQPQMVCPVQGSGAVVLHAHDSSCYDGQGALACALEERAAHTHGPDCYREHRELICTEVPDPGHAHTASCYAQDRGEELTCGMEESGAGHTHTDDCYRQEPSDELICGQEEGEDHAHSDGCYRMVPVKRELKCFQEEGPDQLDEEGNVLVPGHSHTAECWKTEEELRICGQQESQGHSHTDSCYAWTPRLTCQEEERPAGHVHTDGCYEIEQLFVCLEQELASHSHDGSCYDETGALVCGLSEVLAHQHTAGCFFTPEGEAEPVRTLICGQEEHTHTEQCYVRVPDSEGPTFYCGMNEHIHTMSDCFFETGALRCTLMEHVHDLTCMEPPAAPSESPEPSQSQDPEASGSPLPEESQEPVVVEGVELVDAQFPDVYVTDAFTMSFRVNGFAQVAESGEQPQQPQDPLPSPSGEVFMELVENMVPLAAIPRRMAYAVPAGSAPDSAAPPMTDESDSMTASGPVSGPEGTAVVDSSHPPLDDPAQPEQWPGAEPPAATPGLETAPVSMEPAPAETFPGAQPSQEPIPQPEEPERVLLDPTQVRFVVEPLEDGQAMADAMAAAAEMGEEEQATLVQLFTVTAYTGDGRRLDASEVEVVAEVVFSEAFLNYAEHAGEEQISLIGADPAEQTAADVGTVISVVDLESSREVTYAPVSALRAEENSVLFQVRMSKEGGSTMGLMLIKNVYPHFDVQYYAYIKQPVTTTGGEGTLSFIDTSAAANNGEPTRPSNGTTPKTKDIALDENGNMQFDQGTLQQIYRSKDRQFNPLGDLTLEGLMSMTEKDGDDDIAEGLTHYRLKELWVLKDGGDPKSMNTADWVVYPQEQLDQLRFTNNPADVEDDDTGNVILIQETEEKKTVFRLAYEQAERKNESHSAVFYDYDITSGPIRGDGSAGNKYVVNATKQGINSDVNYEVAGEGEDKKQMFGFGNSNKTINTGRGDEAVNQSGGNYGGCFYNIVDGIDGDSVRWSGGITGPKLFGTGDKDSTGENHVAGKTIHNGYSLEFKGEGDTYTLTAVRDPSNAIVSTAKDLDRFGYNRPNWNNTKTIWTNNFWPMDGKKGVDPQFGGPTRVESRNDEGNVLTKDFPLSDIPYVEGGERNPVPDSTYDKKVDHNPYFGMKFTIKFSLPADYTGPLEYYFYGDDDMWVFMGNRLVCDIGGVHSSVGEYVDLWDYVEGTRQDHPAQEYVLTFFYTERGASGSTCWMQYTLPNAVTIPDIDEPGKGPNLTIKKKVDGNMAGDAERDAFYTFDLDLTNAGTQTVAGRLYDAKGRLVKVVEPPTVLADGRHSFTATDEPAEDQSSSADNFNIYFAGGKLRFQLKDGWKLVLQDLPATARYTVTEVFPDGGKPGNCQIAVSKDDGKTQEKGDSASDSAANGSVTFHNSFNYELPETGGAGGWYTMACVPLMAAGCLWYKKRSQGEGAED